MDKAVCVVVPATPSCVDRSPSLVFGYVRNAQQRSNVPGQQIALNLSAHVQDVIPRIGVVDWGLVG